MSAGRTPQGVRGLKLLEAVPLRWGVGSHSARSAWIETGSDAVDGALNLSHSARSAWIETENESPLAYMACVALRKECVD